MAMLSKKNIVKIEKCPVVKNVKITMFSLQNAQIRMLSCKNMLRSDAQIFSGPTWARKNTGSNNRLSKSKISRKG